MADDSKVSAIQSRFKSVSKEEKDKILNNAKAENTNKATEQWISVLREYLAEKNLPILEEILDNDLPSVLSDFYTEVKKKQKSPAKPLKSSKKENYHGRRMQPPPVSDEYKHLH